MASWVFNINGECVNERAPTINPGATKAKKKKKKHEVMRDVLIGC